MFSQNRRLRTVALFLGPLCVGLLSGCCRAPESVRGAAPTAQALVTVHQVTQITQARQVTLQGEMVEKCPVAGCWFKLRDKTGIVRVDTKAAGFVVSDVPLHTQILVQGRVVPDTQASVAATGIRY